jgi:ATP-dependent Clp protease adaptor protein ClpS
MMSNADTKTNTRAKVDVREPPMFRVIYLNDETTAVDFVIGSLVDHFAYSAPDAEALAMTIHQQGAAVVAVLPYEVAEQKGIEVTVSARSEGYPLQIKLEPQAN